MSCCCGRSAIFCARGSSRRQRTTAALLAAVIAFPAGSAQALPVRAERVAGGAVAAVDLQHPPDGSGRLFVVEQGGTVRLLRDGTLGATPFLDLRALVATGGERGLLGLAFHPRYAQNRTFYVNYTRVGDGATVIASFRADAADPHRADPASRREVLVVAQPYENHNGGALRFGPDGHLYIGLGDGGSGNDPGNRAQDPQELLGKMLRIDVDGSAPYAIPSGNAYPQGGGRPEIWASGLRNPWRFAFDRLTGDLYIGDVGQDTQEEIDFLPAGTAGGANLGWRVVEGTVCTGLPGGGACPPRPYAAPILTYGHDEGCSVTGGVVYRGRKVPVLYGRYVYADFCSGRIFAAARDRDGTWRTEVLASSDSGQRITAFGEDADGEVYWTDVGSGQIFRFAAADSVPVAIEYRNAALGHYFLTAFAEEAAALDAGAFGGAWTRTGFAFEVGPVSTRVTFDPQVVDVCRFFGAPGTGPNSHFYTADPAECAGLSAHPHWRFEALAFGMRLPTADACPVPLRPVYRLYNDPATVADVNHRFTVDGATYVAMQAQGWIGEGVAFCTR